MRGILMLYGNIIFAGTSAFGYWSLTEVKSDIGVICSILVIQCSWIAVLLQGIYQNATAKSKQDIPGEISKKEFVNPFSKKKEK